MLSIHNLRVNLNDVTRWVLGSKSQLSFLWFLYMYGFFDESEQQNVSVASRSPLASSVICSNLWVSDLVQLFNLQQPWVAFEKNSRGIFKNGNIVTYVTNFMSLFLI